MTKRASTLINRIRKLADKYPGATYTPIDDESCSYTRGKVENGPEQEGCIVGQAAYGYLRIPLDMDRSGVGTLVIDTRVQGSEEEIAWMSEVQNQQDGGQTWEASVKAADRLVKL